MPQRAGAEAAPPPRPPRSHHKAVAPPEPPASARVQRSPSLRFAFLPRPPGDMVGREPEPRPGARAARRHRTRRRRRRDPRGVARASSAAPSAARRGRPLSGVMASRGGVGLAWARGRGGPDQLRATTTGRPPRDWTGADHSGPARRAGGRRSRSSSREWPLVERVRGSARLPGGRRTSGFARRGGRPFSTSSRFSRAGA